MTADQDDADRPQPRLAELSDARGVAEVHVRTWDVAYRGMVPDAVIDAKTVELREAKWREVLAGGNRLFVVARDGAIAGFLSLVVPSRDADATPTTAELAGLYVDPGHWRSGLARALVDAALAWLADNGEWTDLTLWVLEQNERAQGFYAAAGFAPDGARGAWQGLPDVRLRRPLRP